MEHTTELQIAKAKREVVDHWRAYVSNRQQADLLLLQRWSAKYRELVARPNASTPNAGEAILATF